MPLRVPKRIKGTPTLSHARSRKQEKELAKRVGGRTTRGSGCGNEKGDVRVRGVMRIEAKTTRNKSFSVTRDMVAKIEDTAIANGELPAFVVEFNDGKNPVCAVAVVPLWVIDVISQHKSR